MTGRPPGGQTMADPIPARPGENYHRTRKLGIQTPTAEIRTFEIVADAAAADALETTYKNKAATAVTIVDAHGLSTTNVMILSVAVRFRPVIHAGAAKYEVEAAWTVRRGRQ